MGTNVFLLPNGAVPGWRWAIGRGWIGLLLATLAVTALAAEVPGLYTTWVPVADQQESARESALQVALARVFVKISGKRSPLRDAKLSVVLPTASALVQQYRYESRLLIGADAGHSGLWVQFDSALINELLREAGIRVWGRIRPTVLPWIVVDDGERRSLINGEQSRSAAPDRIAILNRVGNGRGVSVLIPLLDLQDQSSISVANIWNGSEAHIRAASARYPAEAILIGLVQPPAGMLREANWTLVTAGERQSWFTVGDSVELVIEEGMQQCMDRLAVRYAEPAPGGDHSRISVIVSGIRGFGDYATALRALRQPDRTGYVQVGELRGDKASFSVDVNGEAKGLLSVVTMGGVLLPDQSASFSTTVKSPLRLRIVR